MYILLYLFISLTSLIYLDRTFQLTNTHTECIKIDIDYDREKKFRLKCLKEQKK